MIITEQQAISDIRCEFPPAERVAAFAPHPDDEVFGCGGALTILGDGGAKVSTFIVTDGALGGSDPQIVATRTEESLSAARVLGLDAPAFWHLPDRSLAADASLSDRILAALQATAADLVLLPAPTELHPDHQAIAHAGVDAVRRATGVRHVAFYEVSSPLPRPTLVLDISTVLTRKLDAMRCFESQLRELPYDERVLGLNRFRAYYMGPRAGAAEAYVLAQANELADGLPAFFDWPAQMHHPVAERDRRIAALQFEVSQRDAWLADRDAALDEQRKGLADLRAHAAALERMVLDRTLEAEQSKGSLAECRATLDAVWNSTSWRITAPLRKLVDFMRRSG